MPAAANNSPADGSAHEHGMSNSNTISGIAAMRSHVSVFGRFQGIAILSAYSSTAADGGRLRHPGAGDHKGFGRVSPRFRRPFRNRPRPRATHPAVLRSVSA